MWCVARTRGGTLEPVQALRLRLVLVLVQSIYPCPNSSKAFTVPIASHIPYFKAFLKEIYYREEIG